MSQLEQVKSFMQAFGQATPETPAFPDNLTVNLRLALIKEEVSELEEAIENKDLVEVADALGDILYVVHGAAIAFGLPMDSIFNEIHASNMSKLGLDGKPIYREDGKILKGEKFFVPNIEQFVK